MRARDLGRPVTEPALRPKLIDPFLDKIEEWVERSEGKVRADIVHERLVPMGFAGTERTTRSGERRRPVTASAAQARSASTRPSRKQKRRNARQRGHEILRRARHRGGLGEHGTRDVPRRQARQPAVSEAFQETASPGGIGCRGRRGQRTLAKQVAPGPGS